MFGIAVQFVFIYLVAWWLVLFMVLPVGIKTDDDVKQGNDTGAPKRARIKKRILWTSLITLVITFAVVWLLNTVPLEDLIGNIPS